MQSPCTINYCGLMLPFDKSSTWTTVCCSLYLKKNPIPPVKTSKQYLIQIKQLLSSVETVDITIEQPVVWSEKIWIVPMFEGQRIKYFFCQLIRNIKLISLWIINITTHLDYNLCTLVIVVSGYLCTYIQFKLYFGWTYILPPMLKCPVRNHFMCPVRNAVIF